MSEAQATLSPPSRRSQAARRTQSERTLIRATLSVVAEQGVSAATFATIGQAAGYSRGLATHKFGSKAGLIDAVIDFLHQERDAHLEAAHVAEMHGLDALIFYADSHLRDLAALKQTQAYFMLLAQSAADLTEVRKAFAASHARVRVWLEDVIRRGQGEGVVRRELDPTSGALVLGSLLMGLSFQWLIDPDADLEPTRATALQALRQMFAAPAFGDTP